MDGWLASDGYAMCVEARHTEGGRVDGLVPLKVVEGGEDASSGGVRYALQVLLWGCGGVAVCVVWGRGVSKKRIVWQTFLHLRTP